MNLHTLKMSFEIKTTQGAVLKPVSLHSIKQSSSKNISSSEKHFKFMTDSIVGLQFLKLIGFKSTALPDQKFILKALETFCPYAALYKNSAHRLASEKLLGTNFKLKKTVPNAAAFEDQWFSFWNGLDFDVNFDLNKLSQAIEMISVLETELKSALIYNTQLQLSEKAVDHLNSFYSFLFHLRSLVAIDHNSQVDDTAFESVKCDSISDYLPKADFTTNDALVYWQFKKLSTPFVRHESKDISNDTSKDADKDIRIEKLFVNPMQRAFQQYNHNACVLIDSLPEDYLSKFSNSELENKLHQVQMDWLLGTPAGLLFRVREELYGLAHGYDKVFWPEASEQSQKQATFLNIDFELTESDLRLASAS